MKKEKKTAAEFRREKIAEKPKNEVEEHLREEFIERERGKDSRKDKLNKEKLREAYFSIIEILKKYLDLKEEYYSLIALWIIGTYNHDKFNSYPYLYFNAMRGSGKSRALNLITSLTKDGKVMASPTEAVLFRTNGTLAIDEFEGVVSKEKSMVRELLNASYKKGVFILRMKKKSGKDGEEQVVESFETYRPILMANISGMDEVLGDRCIQLILEKSSNPAITKLIEDFENNPKINYTRNSLVTCSLCICSYINNVHQKWNEFISDKYITTLTTLTTNNTANTNNIEKDYRLSESGLKDLEIISLFNKIEASEIQGRNLELFLPIFFIAMEFDDLILKEAIKTAGEIIGERRKEEEMESVDVMLYDFISKKQSSLDYCSIKILTDDFRQFIGESEDWLNSKWLGRALKRLNLIVDKRRITRGVEVILNIPKAKEKIKMFRLEDEDDKKNTNLQPM